MKMFITLTISHHTCNTLITINGAAGTIKAGPLAPPTTTPAAEGRRPEDQRGLLCNLCDDRDDRASDRGRDNK